MGERKKYRYDIVRNIKTNNAEIRMVSADSPKEYGAEFVVMDSFWSATAAQDYINKYYLYKPALEYVEEVKIPPDDLGGGYWGKCLRCGRDFIGEKRQIYCDDCNHLNGIEEENKRLVNENKLLEVRVEELENCLKGIASGINMMFRWKNDGETD